MTRCSPPVRPFAGCDSVFVVPPTLLAHLSDEDAAFITELPQLLSAEAHALARELGAPIEVCTTPPASDAPTWLIGPRELNPAFERLDLAPSPQAVHHLDRGKHRLVTDVPSIAGLMGALAGLRSLARLQEGAMAFGHAHTLDEAITTVAVETWDTVPGLRHKLDWHAFSERAMLQVRAASDPIAAIQRWLAVLGDSHTTLRPAHPWIGLPYRAEVVRGGLRLLHVPTWTLLAEHGVVAGDCIVHPTISGILARTAAPSHAKSMLAAVEALSGAADTYIDLDIKSHGKRLVIEECFTPPTGPLVHWEALDAHTAYLWIGAWSEALDTEAALLEALEASRDFEHLVVDLRGNSGGRLDIALRFRDRLLREPLEIGWERFTEPGGRMGAVERLHATPAEGIRFEGRVTFLVDETTLSASERLLLGLRHEPWVRVVGRTTGGGTGRVRRMPLLPGWRLSLTTSVVRECGGPPLGNQGLDPDVEVAREPETGDEDHALDVAQQAWSS